MTKSGQKFLAVKGMHDVMPPQSKLWQEVEGKVRSVFDTYGYHEIRTPIVEFSALFKRGVGENTAVVEKEMYSFVDINEDSLSLRPEGTASVVRAYIESGAFMSESITRYYYMGPMFRRERPQKGRQREFYQIGPELLGVVSPMADAEVIAMGDHFLKEVGVRDFVLEINSIGCPACRPKFNEDLLNFLRKSHAKLCADCVRRVERNPMRVLDCKQHDCKELVSRAPKMPDYWCEECKTHFGEVQRALKEIKIPFELNPRIVRGLDYYVRTAFEFSSTQLGAQSAIAAGGRYDGLVKALGGPDVAGVGFALGVERLLILLEAAGKKPTFEDLVFFAVLGDEPKIKALPIIQTLRKDGIRVEWDYTGKSLKSQMRMAARHNAETVVIIGGDELAKGHAIVRDMRAGTQREVGIKELPMHFTDIGG